jgi:F0F1-type ATP synthase assembly protein I
MAARERPIADLYRYSGLGLAFAATVGLFALIGRWLDGRWGTSPWFLLGGVFLGFGLGLYSMLKKLPPSSAQRQPPPDRSR